MKRIFLWTCSVAWCQAAQSAWAEDGTSYDFFSMAARMIFVMSLILAVMLAVLYVLKKTNLTKKTLLGGQHCMEIVDRLFLGPKRSIILLKVGGEYVLLGITDQHITYLSTIAELYGEGTEDRTDHYKENARRGLAEKLSGRPDTFLSTQTDSRLLSTGYALKSILQNIMMPHKQRKTAKGVQQ